MSENLENSEKSENSEQPEKTLDCLVCNLPLGELELSLNRKWHYDCKKCEHCGDTISDDIFNKWLNGKGPRAHSSCHDNYVTQELKNRPIVVTQGTLDILNRFRMMIEPDVKMVRLDDERESEKLMKEWIHELPIEQIRRAHEKMQNLAAALAIVLKNEEKYVTNRLAELKIKPTKVRDEEKLNDAYQHRVDQRIEKEKRAEKKSPEGKAIAAFMKLGISEEDAKKMVAASKKTE